MPDSFTGAKIELSLRYRNNIPAASARLPVVLPIPALRVLQHPCRKRNILIPGLRTPAGILK